MLFKTCSTSVLGSSTLLLRNLIKMNNKPISVITINFNDKAGLIKTLQSVAKQDKDLFEYIVIDGGSIDGSREEIKKNLHLIDRFVSEKDDGIYDAMNKGILLSSGEYVYFLNSGDYFYGENVLENVCRVLNSHPSFYLGRVIYRYADGNVKSDKITMPSIHTFEASHQALFYKKDLHHTLGLYDSGFRSAGDYDFFMRCLKAGYFKSKNKEDFIIAVRTKDGSDSSDSLVHLVEMTRIDLVNKVLLNTFARRLKTMLILVVKYAIRLRASL